MVFRHFGVDVFLFSDVSDYLLASFRTPTVWFIVAFSMVVMYLDQSASLRVARSPGARRWIRWYGSRRYRRFGWVVLLPLVVDVLTVHSTLGTPGRTGPQ